MGVRSLSGGAGLTTVVKPPLRHRRQAGLSPDSILDNDIDHRKPVDGDHGVRFEVIDSISEESVVEMVGFR